MAHTAVTAGGVSMEFDSRALDAKLTAFAKTTRNMLPFWRSVGEILRKSIVQNFRVGGRPDPWKPLSEITKQYKRKNKNKILVESGRLRGSINYKADASGVSVGTSGVEYAAIHQFGGDTGTATIPARPYVLIQPEDMETIAQDLEDYLTLPFEGVGK